MIWYQLVAWFFGGAIAANFVPHFVQGISGAPFQSPFAKPPGEGLSSSTVNVAWALFNGVIAYLLMVRVGSFDLRSWVRVGVFSAGFAVPALGLARHMGRFHGGRV